MSLDNQIKQLEKELDLETSIRREAEGVYVFAADDTTFITIAAMEEGGVRLMSEFAQVPDVPDPKLEELFTQLLLADLFGQGTDGGVIGLDDAGKAVTLSLEIEEGDTDWKAFYEGLEDFLNVIDFWRGEMTELVGG